MYKFYEEINGELSPLSDTMKIAAVKNELLTGRTYAYIKVIGTNLILTEENYVKNFDISELRFVPDNGVFGQCVAKKLDINIYNEDMQFTLQDKELEVYIRVKIDNAWYYVKYGTFIVQRPENETTTDNTSFTALDYMIKFNQVYVNTITYPCTLRQLASNICAQLGVTLAAEDFRNQNFIVENNQFEDGESYRNVLQGIAMSAFSWARIDENNILHFDLNKKTDADEEIDYDGYFKLNKQDLNYGPLNRIIIREGEIEGENVTIEDAESIEEYGATELVIADNPFAYTQEKRQQLIEAGRNLFGFTYMPINEVSLIGYAYLDSTSKIRFKTLQDTYIDTYLFNHIISYNGVTLDKMEAPALTKTETLYAYKPEISESVKRTEIIVDKQNQTIQSVVSNVSEQNQKIAIIQQDVDEIKSEIQDIADITESKESTTASVSIDDITESEPVRIVVHPIGTNISFLYPSLSLYPSGNLYMPVRIIRFANTTTGENFDYELPTDLLYYDAENYDEFILDYEGQSCVVNKRVGYNADGTTYVLPSEQTIEYDYPQIELTDGDYTISLIGYQGGYLFARMMVKNIYTDQFATKAELNSAIRQTKDEIDLSVNQKLTNYSTTTEMNTAIDIKANQITTSVSETYETKNSASNNYNTLNNKFGNYYTKTETNSQIEQTASQITTRVESVETRVGTLESDSIIQVDVEYALSTSTTTAPSSGWSTTAPQWEQGKYMWERTKVTYADNTTETSDPTCIAGAKGDTGETGTGVSSIEEQYYLSTSASTPTGGTWKSTQDTWQDGMYIWTRSKVTWTNNTITYTTPVLANGLNNANETAKSASDTASTTQAYAENINSSLGGRLDTADAEIAGIRETLVTQNTTIEVNKNSLEASINTLTEETTRIGDQVTHNETEQKKYLRYYEDPNNDNKGTLELGENDSPFKTKITNDEMAFTENDSKVAYINSKKMYITTAEILNSLVLGNFGFTPLANGSVTFGKVK